MALATQTLTRNTIAAIALDKLSDKIADNISTSCASFFMMKEKGNWQGTASGGHQLRKAVMYQLQTVRPISSFGTVNVNPTESHTFAYFDWVQTAVPVSFSDLEEFRTGGSESIMSIVKAKYQQASASLEDFFARAYLRGQGDNDDASFTTANTSPTDGSYFIDPLPKIVDLAPTGSRSVGNINQANNSWWQNQLTTSTATTLAGFLGELRYLHIKCQRGGQGKNAAPDHHLLEEQTFNSYERALSVSHRNPSYSKADIPFDNVLFKGAPVFHDQYMPDVTANSKTVTEGDWYMLNSDSMGFEYDKKKSFKLGANVRPGNQLVTSALMPVRGALWCNNRRKQGLATSILVATLQSATS